MTRSHQSRSVIASAAFVISYLLFPAISYSTEVGTIPGQFAVDPTGAATYTIPIEVPPGIGGLQPNLALTYNSRAGNGLLGVGWSLSGLSAITRCPQTLAQDGKIHGVDFSSEDRFCLDGQRLMVMQGSYGEENSEYRTETDSFAKIQLIHSASTGELYFIAHLKSGETMELGNTVDSRIQPLNLDGSVATDKTSVWAVNRISDSVGNYLTVSYATNSQSGEFHAERIEYAGNQNTGMAASNSIQFVYEYNRTDTVTQYRAGTRLAILARLQHLRIYSGASQIADYRISYAPQQDLDKSRIVQIDKCVGSEACEGSNINTQFVWIARSGVGEWQAVNASDTLRGISGDGDHQWLSGDFNGDGLADLARRHINGEYNLVLLADGQGGWDSISGSDQFRGISGDDDHQWLSGDFDGDGKTDLARRHIDGTYNLVLLADGVGGWTPVSGADNFGGVDGDDHNQWLTGDFNGDGKTDLARRHIDGTYNLVLLADGVGGWTPVSGADNFGGIDGDDHNQWLTGDFNGDGLTDLVRRHIDGTFNLVLLADGEGGWIPKGGTDNFGGIDGDDHNQWLTGDFNGDGLTDLARRHIDGTYNLVLLADGEGGWIPKSGTENFKGIDGDGQNQWLTGDFNGDGLTDLARRHIEGTYNLVLLANGQGGWIPKSSSDNFKGISEDGVHQWLIGDFNGDGLTDLLRRHKEGTYNSVLMSSGTMPAEYVETIHTNVDSDITIAYEPLTNKEIYTGSPTTLPGTRSFQGPIYVVSNVQADNGINGQRTTTYNYGGAKIDLQGRGFLGFEWMKSTDTDTSIVSRTEFRQDFPCTGMPTYTTTMLGTVTLSETTHSNFTDTTSANGRVHFPQVLKSEQKDFELDGSEVKTTVTESTYDDFGNPETITVFTTGGGRTFTKTTTNVYTNDTINWFLGRLTRATVEHADGVNPVVTRVSGFEYDPDTGLLSKEIIEPNSTDPNIRLTTAYGRDGYGNITAKTVCSSVIDPYDCPPGLNDPNARTTQTAYDYTQLGVDGTYTVTTTNAVGLSETRLIDARFGVTKTLIGPNQLTTTWDYDGFGRKTDEYRADGTATHIERAWCDSATCPGLSLAKYKITTTVSGKPTVTVYYDALNRELRKETVGFSGTPIYVDTQYDALGRVERVSDPYGSGGSIYWTEYGYDAIGRIVQETLPGNRVTGKTHGGLVTAVTDPLGHSTTQTKDALGRLVQVTDASQNTTFYGYDAVGNLTDVTDAQGNITHLDYDVRGRKRAMNDPDMGQWSYDYNSFGELTHQRDAKGQESWLYYDKLGRMQRRTENEGDTVWTYYDSNAAVGNRGKLHQVTSPGGYLRSHAYDALGRPQSVSTSIDGHTYTHDTGYDGFSRPNSLTYPSGLTVKQAYNARGYLERVYNFDDTLTYWHATEANARGQITQEALGNGLTTTRVFNAETGYIEQIGTGASAGYWNVQSLGFVFDAVGNLQERHDDMQLDPNGGTLTETFGYDELNRLTSATLTGVGTTEFQYDAIGNLTHKSDVSAADYVYDDGSGKPHAVKNAAGVAYSYDANGSMTSGGGRTLGYTSFNKPNSISKGDTSLTFLYGADRARIKQVRTDSTGTRITYYVGLYEREIKGSLITERNTIVAGGHSIAIQTTRSNGSNDLRYLHRDHQGTLNAITDESGTVKERFSFDAWGRPRKADWAYDPVGNFLSNVTRRGYTGHEHLNDVGLIHMNGRVYDPTLGRVLSADPIVQAPANPQSLNRYSYVINNPLALVDPTGYSWLSRAFRRIARIDGVSAIAFALEPTAITLRFDYYMRSTSSSYRAGSNVAASVASVFFGPWVSAANAAINTAATGGSISDIASASISSYIYSYLSINSVAKMGGDIQAAFSEGNFGPLLQTLGHHYANQLMREAVSKFAEEHGMSLSEFNSYLFIVSLTGNLVTESRASLGEGAVYIQGVNTRGFGAWIFDAADVVLGYQGLPTATSLDYMMHYQGADIVAHSLGSIDAVNLAGYGVAGSVQAAALPFMNIAPSNTEVVINAGDFVTGFGFGQFLNPGASVINIAPTVGAFGNSLGHDSYLVYGVFAPLP